MAEQSSTLALVRPGGQHIFRLAMYVMAFVFYGPLSMAILLPFDLPQGHPAFYVVYGIGTSASLVLVHWAIRKMMNDCYFTLTAQVLELGNSPKTVVAIGDVVDTIPVAYHYRPFRQPKASASPNRFNILLLRLRNGSRLPLSPVSNVAGFDIFFAKLLEVLKPTFRESAALSPEDVAAMRPGRVNKVQVQGVASR
jgi:hypothetical protein